ncbi:MAG: complex I subunit 1 family protein [Nocardioidaceae bacterium]
MDSSLSMFYALPVLAGLVVLAVAVAGFSGALEARDRGLPLRTGFAMPAREAARLMHQRPRRTLSADRLLWRAASSAVIPLGVLIVAFVPLGAHSLVDHPLGLVWINALDVVAWAVMWLLGWGANSISGLVGGYRFLALALAYELPLMFALTAPAIAAGSLDLAEVAAAQDGLWFVVWAPVAFAAYCWGILGFSVRPPMDPGAGADISGGILAELAGVDRLLVLAGRYVLLVAGSAAAVPLFLGGGAGAVLPGWLWVLTKTLVLSVLLVGIGRRVPSLRPDKLLEVGWAVVIPLVIAQDLVVSIIAVATHETP